MSIDMILVIVLVMFFIVGVDPRTREFFRECWRRMRIMNTAFESS